MPGTGKHELKTRQQSDGTFEFVVEESEVSEVVETASSEKAAEGTSKTRASVIVPAIVLVVVAAAVAVGIVVTSAPDDGKKGGAEMNSGFRPYSGAPNAENNTRSPAKIVLPEIEEDEPEPEVEERDIVIEDGFPPEGEIEEGVEAIIENDGEVEDVIEEELPAEDVDRSSENFRLDPARANIRAIGRSAIGAKIRDRMRADGSPATVAPKMLTRPQIAIPVQETVVGETVIEESEEIPPDVEIIEE